MNPIIDPATLTQEQREEIRKAYFEIEEDSFPVCEFEEKLMFAENALSYFEWLFGESMFDKLSAEPLCPAKKGE